MSALSRAPPEELSSPSPFVALALPEARRKHKTCVLRLVFALTARTQKVPVMVLVSNSDTRQKTALAETPRTPCASAAGIGHSSNWTWGMRLLPTFKNCFARGERKNLNLCNIIFSFQTLHLTSLPAGTLCKAHGSLFIWENMCSTIRKAAGEQRRLERYGWNAPLLLHSVLRIFKYGAKLQTGGIREIPTLNVCSAKSNKSVGSLGLCTFL